MSELTINDVIELEAMAELMIEKASRILTQCRNAKKKLAGVSTPAALQGADAKLKAEVLAKRQARLNRRRHQS